MSRPRDNKVTTFHEEPFTNHLGQVVNPGDKVVVVATGYCHALHVREGTFLGVRVARPGSHHPGGHVVSVSVRVKDRTWASERGRYVDCEVLRAYARKRVYALKP